MEHETTIQLLEQRERIQGVISKKEEQLAGLTKEGWVEDYLAQIGRPDSLSHLRLQGIDTLTYFDHLINHIKPLQTTIRDERLPALRSKLDQLILNQKSGLVSLFTFLYQGEDFAKVAPFTLNLSNKTFISTKDLDQTYSFFLGKANSNKYLSLTISSKLSPLDQVVVKPEILTRDHMTYYWLDFFARESLHPFNSCRLLPDQEKGNINFKSWRGIEQQLLADYLLRDNGISFEDLLPFDIYIKHHLTLAGYWIGGQKQLLLRLDQNPHLKIGDTIKLTPKEDEQKFYQWLEVAKGKRIVASYRLLKEDHTLKAAGWFGAERQLFLKYLSSDPKVTFDNLRPMKLSNSSSDWIQIGEIGKRQIGLYLSTKLPPDAKLIITPKQDQSKLYQWLEVYQLNQESDTPMGECLASARILNGEILRAYWLGLEKQLLKDYTEGQISFDNLKPISFKLTKNLDYLHLWKEKGGHAYLVLSKHFPLKPGDEVVLQPEPQEDGDTFILKKSNSILGRYRFDKENKSFPILHNTAANGNLELKYDPYSKSYVDNQGDIWMTISGLMKKFHISFPRANRVINCLPKIRYLGHADRHLNLYREDQVRTALTLEETVSY